MNKLKTQKTAFERFSEILLIILTAAFLGAVVYMNFHVTPCFEDGDTYTDISFAVRAWREKTLFPDGWIFGNQYYILATPVFAALFYGIIKNALLAMAAASTLMTVLILAAYNYMLKPFASLSARLGGFLTFASFSALLGHLTGGSTGWQLFFTMDSYYACYFIVAMICFGCYARTRTNIKGASVWIMIAVSCLTSFAMGMQSLRQTEIMVLPLIITEALLIVYSKIRKEKFNSASLISAAAISVSNIAGHFFVRLLNIPHNEIFGTQKKPAEAGIKGFIDKTLDIIKLSINIKTYKPLVYLTYFTVIAITVIALFLMFCRFIKKKKLGAIAVISFTAFVGVGGIAFLYVFSSMEIRGIYFFMTHLLVALSATYLLSSKSKFTKPVLLAAVLFLFAATAIVRFIPDSRTVTDKKAAAVYNEAAEYAVENDYSVVYANWLLIGRIATAADGQLDIGMWDEDTEELMFIPVDYLGDPRVFDRNDEAIYVVYGSEYGTALKKAAEKGIEITEVFRTESTVAYRGEMVPLVCFKSAEQLCTK